jgi:hypothetical protein
LSLSRSGPSLGENVRYDAVMEPISAEIADSRRKLERLHALVENGKIEVEDLAPRVSEPKEQMRISDP